MRGKKVGRPKIKGLDNYHVKLVVADVEWAMTSPEGLSGLLRRLLSEERLRRDGGLPDTRPDALSPKGRA